MKTHWINTVPVLLLAGSLLACRPTPGTMPAPTSTSPATTTSVTAATSKQVYIPAQVWRVPDGNKYEANTSEYSNLRRAESPNLVAFWANEYGTDPAANPIANRQFNITNALAECERFYRVYADSLRFVQKGKSLTDRYKMLLYVFGGTEESAFGGGAEDKIGILWTPAVRMNKAPYGALAHELGHSFQYMVHADGAWGFTSAPQGSRGQAIFEMTSQYMLWQVYPEWMTFENYHLKSFMQKTHYAFLHETNQYHSPYVLEYWANKHGIDFVGKLWREAQSGEDPVLAYQRLTAISQQQFNDEIIDAARRFITWDMKRIEKVAAPYANQHYTTLNPIGDDWYRIAPANCPQNYGYNGVKLQVPAAGTPIQLQFRGTAGAAGFRAIKQDKAGWRYGFLAVQEDGRRVYGEIGSQPEATLMFTVPPKTSHLWLVVTGAPTAHWEHLTDGNDDNDEQWPYQIKLSGTSPDSSIIKPVGQ